MSFKIAARFRHAASTINNIPTEKFPLLLNRVIQKLHLKSKLFSSEEETQLQSVFGLSADELKLVLDGCCYIFEQAAFSSVGPEPLYEILLEAGFDEPHGKIVGRLWATEAPAFIAKLKARPLGYTSLLSSDYHLNLKVSENAVSKEQEPTAIFELALGVPPEASAHPPKEEKMTIEFNHEQLYDFFSQLERIQQQLDNLSH